MEDHIERILNTLQEQNNVMHTQGLALATLVQETKSTNERLFGVGDTPGIFSVVAKHHTQLGYIKGAAGVLSLLWTALVAIFVAKIKHH
jgi:hypothetical protein